MLRAAALHKAAAPLTTHHNLLALWPQSSVPTPHIASLLLSLHYLTPPLPADAPRGSLPMPTDPVAAAAVAAGQRLYADSIESLVRNQIQRTKIEMANEVIDAGRWVGGQAGRWQWDVWAGGWEQN